MKTEYLPSFIKDLKKLKGTTVYSRAKQVAFEEIPSLSDFSQIIHIKRIKASDRYYRLRVGDYRIGFYYDGETIVFMRILHRKEIYRFFPLVSPTGGFSSPFCPAGRMAMMVGCGNRLF